MESFRRARFIHYHFPNSSGSWNKQDIFSSQTGLSVLLATIMLKPFFWPVLFWCTTSNITQHNNSKHKQNININKRNQNRSSYNCYLSLFLTILWINFCCWNLVMNWCFEEKGKRRIRSCGRIKCYYPDVAV